MKIVAHISDLHFGTEQPEIAAALERELDALAPSLVVVSGDLTQRARSRQFQQARDYLTRLPKPQLVVPGNHDVPLFDVFRRIFFPLTRYKRFISEELNPTHVEPTLCVFGLNTARSLTWKSGRISCEQIEKLEMQLKTAPEGAFRIVVTHHPFIPPPGKAEGAVKLVGRAREALRVIEKHRVDMLLAGHLHEGYTGDVRRYYPENERAIIVVQAGTAISQRVRGNPNAYNVIRLEEDRIEVWVHTWDGGSFRKELAKEYRCKEQQWELLSVSVP